MRFFAFLLAVCLAFLPRAFAQDRQLPAFGRGDAPPLDLSVRPAQLPDLGDAGSADLTPVMERRIGETIMRDLRRDPSFLDDPEVSEYLNSLGARLLAAAPGVRQDFEFFAMRESSINAFAMPGGFIGVHTGLITASDSESEVAAVLSHEIAHVTQRHIARQMGIQKQMQVPAMLAMFAAVLLGRSRPDLASGAMAAVQGTAVSTQLAFSRDFEREADRLGFQTLQSAGFDVRAMSDFFEKMQRYTRLVDTGAVPSYLRSHPITTDRISDAQARAEGAPYRQHADSVDYHLVRSRLRAEAMEPRDAVRIFTDAVNDRRFLNEAAARYGLAVALLRAKEPKAAEAEIARLRAARVASPMVDSLAARARLAQGDNAGALALLKAAIARYPQRRSLLYAALEMQLDARQFDEVQAMLADPMRVYPRDSKLFEARAKAYAGQGKELLSHQSLAEAYYLRGALPAAIEQLQFAQTAKDGNFYEQSVVDARLKQLRAELALEKEDSRRR